MITVARMWLLMALTILAGALLLAGMASGAPCRIRVQKVVAVQHHAYVPYAVNQNFFYDIGGNIRQQAAIDKLVEDRVKEELAKYKSIHDGKPAFPDAQPVLADAIKKNCAACHSGATPKGGLLLDGTAPLSPEQILSAMKRIEAGEMPPKNPLSPDDAGAVFSELLKLSEEK